MNLDFHGWPTRSLRNQQVRVDFLAEAGPRIVRLCLAGSDENLLAETPEHAWQTPFGTYHCFGGHRLWHGPEVMPRSSVPDDTGLTVTALTAGVRLEGAIEQYTGVRKTIDIHLPEDLESEPGHGPLAALRLVHRIENRGAWPIELAPWAITQLPLGGKAVLPQSSPARDAAELGPNRQLALWPYTHWHDPRLCLGDDVIVVNPAPPPDPDAGPCKIGYFNHAGWIGYLRNGLLFGKRFSPQPGLPHVDFGCNVEVYCNSSMIELETLGPLTRLAPGETVEHTETWEIYAANRLPADLSFATAL